MPLINCKVSLTLTWSENCVLTDVTTQTARAAQGANPARPAKGTPTSATFQIKDTKLYVPVVTLSTKDYTNFQNNSNQDLKELLYGINKDQK